MKLLLPILLCLIVTSCSNPFEGMVPKLKIENINGLEDYFYPLDSTEMQVFKYEITFKHALNKKQKKRSKYAYVIIKKESENLYSLCNYDNNFQRKDSSILELKTKGITIKEFWLDSKKKQHSILAKEAPYFKWEMPRGFPITHTLNHTSATADKGVTSEERSLALGGFDTLQTPGFNGNNEIIHFNAAKTLNNANGPLLFQSGGFMGNLEYLKGVGFYKGIFSSTADLGAQECWQLIETFTLDEWNEMVKENV